MTTSKNRPSDPVVKVQEAANSKAPTSASTHTHKKLAPAEAVNGYALDRPYSKLPLVVFYVAGFLLFGCWQGCPLFRSSGSARQGKITLFENFLPG